MGACSEVHRRSREGMSAGDGAAELLGEKPDFSSMALAELLDEASEATRRRTAEALENAAKMRRESSKSYPRAPRMDDPRVVQQKNMCYYTHI